MICAKRKKTQLQINATQTLDHLLLEFQWSREILWHSLWVQVEMQSIISQTMLPTRSTTSKTKSSSEDMTWKIQTLNTWDINSLWIHNTTTCLLINISMTKTINQSETSTGVCMVRPKKCMRFQNISNWQNLQLSKEKRLWKTWRKKWQHNRDSKMVEFNLTQSNRGCLSQPQFQSTKFLKIQNLNHLSQTNQSITEPSKWTTKCQKQSLILSEVWSTQ